MAHSDIIWYVFDVMEIGGLATVAVFDAKNRVWACAALMAAGFQRIVLGHPRVKDHCSPVRVSILHCLSNGVAYSAYKAMTAPLLGGVLVQKSLKIIFEMSRTRVQFLVIAFPVVEFLCWRLRRLAETTVQNSVVHIIPLLTLIKNVVNGAIPPAPMKKARCTELL